MPDSRLRPRNSHETARLLWEVCHRTPDPTVVTEAIGNGADVRWAAPFAVQQRIGPLLWKALEESDAVDALGDSRDSLKAVADVHKVEALLLFPRAVSAALVPLIEGGLEPVVLKGPVLASRYPAPGLRPMEDIDLLLPMADHSRALDLLGRAGWRIARPARRDRYDTVLRHGEIPSLALELHYGLESAYERVTSLDPLALWQRRVPVDCLGTRAFGLPLPEELVALAVHAGKPYHGFTRLVWIADLAMVVGHEIERGGAVDWHRMRQISEEGRCTTVVATALGLARHAGVEQQMQIFPIPDRGWRARALARMLELTWPLDASDDPTFHLRYALTDGWWRRVRLLVGSGHGMTTWSRIRWSAAAPAEALTRWWELHRRSQQDLDAA